MIKIDHTKVDTFLGEIDFVKLKSSDMEVILTSYGAAVYQIRVFGRLVTVAPMEIDTFLRSPYYYGKTVGRTAGRLILPSFKIDHTYFPISSFKGEHVKLHGGPTGFSFRHFKLIEKKEYSDRAVVSFSYRSQHMEEEFPGELAVKVIYTLSQDMKLTIQYEAISDLDTLCNLTNHTYFNLSSDCNNILEHEFKINADHYLELNKDMMIQSKKSVNGTPFDFLTKKHLGTQIDQMRETSFNGFDHTWIFNDEKQKIEIDEPSSLVKMVVETSYPAVVIYTHNHPAPSKLEQFKHDGTHSSFTLECQYEPGGIHFPYLNSAILRKKQKYNHFMSFQFIEK